MSYFLTHSAWIERKNEVKSRFYTLTQIDILNRSKQFVFRDITTIVVVVKFCFVGKTAETAFLFSACLSTENIFPYQTCIYGVDNVSMN